MHSDTIHVADEPRWVAINPSFCVDSVADAAVLLRNEEAYVVLEGADVARVLLGLRDGARPVAELVRLTADMTPPDQIRMLLDELVRRGFVVGHDPETLPAEAAFWVRMDLDAERVRRRLQQVQINVHAFGDLDAAPFKAVLEALNLSLQDGEARGWTVVLTDDYLREELAAVNLSAWTVGRPWMPVKPAGRIVWIGPIIVPGRTACWACLATRLRANRRAEALVQHVRKGKAAPPPLAMLSISAEIAYRMAALEVLQGIVRDEPGRLENTLLTFDLMNWKATYHHVTRLPHCPVCGTGGSCPQQPPVPAAAS